MNGLYSNKPSFLSVMTEFFMRKIRNTKFRIQYFVRCLLKHLVIIRNQTKVPKQQTHLGRFFPWRFEYFENNIAKSNLFNSKCQAFSKKTFPFSEYIRICYRFLSRRLTFCGSANIITAPILHRVRQVLEREFTSWALQNKRAKQCFLLLT